MRIRTILAAAAAPAAIAAALLGTAAPAAHAATLTASVGSPASNGQAGQMTGNRAAVYTDGVFGPVQCNETQHPKFDTVSCKFTAGQLQTPGTTGTVGWNTDFTTTNEGVTLPSHVNTGVLAYTVNADGSGYTGQATYPNG